MKWIKRVVLVTSIGVASFLGTGGTAFADCATTPNTPECVATTAGTEIKDTGIGLVVILVPLAVLLFLALRAWFLARRVVKF